MSSKKYVFVPSFGIGADRDKLKKLNPNLEFGIFFKPIKKGNKFSVYSEIGVNRQGKWIAFSRLNYMLGNKKKVVKTKPKPRVRSKLLNKRKLK